MHRSNGFATQAQQHFLKTALFSVDKTDDIKLDPAIEKLLPLLAKNGTRNHPLNEKAKTLYRKTWTSNQLLWRHTRPLLEQLQQAGIHQILLLKGMAMILQYYCDFGVRVIGDIDILIPKKDLKTAIDLLSNKGWVSNLPRLDLQNEDQLSRWHAANFTHPQGGCLDLHWSMFLESSPFFDKAVFEAAHLYDHALLIPCREDLLLQTCIHGIKHSPLALIRWIPDALTLLKKPLDWDRVVYFAKQLQVTRSLYEALLHLTQDFEAPIPAPILKQLASQPQTRWEKKEYLAHQKGQDYLAGWYRYRLSHQRSSIPPLLRYLQATAFITSFFKTLCLIPYWIWKHLILKTDSGIK